MAVTSIWRIKGYVGKVILYAMNPEKTIQSEVIEIKTKEVVRTVKEHAESAVKNKAAEVGIRTKDEAVRKVQEQFTPENRRQNTQQSPENYATDKTESTAKSVSESTAAGAQQAVKKSAQKIKEKRAKKKTSRAGIRFQSQFPNGTPLTRVRKLSPCAKENCIRHRFVCGFPTVARTVRLC